MHEELLYRVALKKLPGIGPQKARLLVSYCGGVRPVFDSSYRELISIPGLSAALVKKLDTGLAIEEAHKELEFIEKHDLQTFFFLDDNYPERLRHCEDGPVLLYGRGNLNFNLRHVVSIVGTRNCTEYGQRMCERLVEGLWDYDVLIVSGLAYGIDTIAHRAAVQCELPTVGVLGHSLDRIYPAVNRELTNQMMTSGGVITEFEMGTMPDRENFPQRNRIVAGMADVTVVVETPNRGGSMITARLAAGYNRDVAAFPGTADAEFSKGCNHLIKTNVAALIEDVEDLIYLMGWEVGEKNEAAQKQLFVELSDTEKKLVETLQKRKKESLDNLSLTCNLPVSKTASALLDLEFRGVVRSLPGKIYTLS